MARKQNNADAKETTMNGTLEIEGMAFGTAGEAMQYSEAAGYGAAVRVDGKNLVVRQAAADRMAAAGVEFAYLCDHDGQIMHIPIN